MRFFSRPSFGGTHQGYDPNQPRVPAGNPDGGQWTSSGGSSTGSAEERAASWRWLTGSNIPVVLAAERPPRGLWPAVMWAIFEAYRNRELLYDLFRNEIGTLARTEINGKEVFGVNSDSPAFKSEDDRAARRLRATLIEKYPHVMQTKDIGRFPNDAVFHAETTTLLRARAKNGGTLTGQTLVVFVDRALCPSCLEILPYIVRELGNPTVMFVPRVGKPKILKDGDWLD